MSKPYNTAGSRVSKPWSTAGSRMSPAATAVSRVSVCAELAVEFDAEQVRIIFKSFFDRRSRIKARC